MSIRGVKSCFLSSLFLYCSISQLPLLSKLMCVSVTTPQSNRIFLPRTEDCVNFPTPSLGWAFALNKSKTLPRPWGIVCDFDTCGSCECLYVKKRAKASGSAVWNNAINSVWHLRRQRDGEGEERERDGMLFINVFERREREGWRTEAVTSTSRFPHHTQSTSCQSNSTELLVAHYYESKGHNPTKHVKLFQSREKTLDTMLTMGRTAHLS